MDRIESIVQKLLHLQELRNQLLESELAPPGAWIHQYEVKKFYSRTGTLHTFRYAKWQASEPIFQRNPKKHGHRGSGKYTRNKHIGRIWSSSGLDMDDEVRAAYQAWDNRKRLDSIEKLLSDIEAGLQQVMPSEDLKT